VLVACLVGLVTVSIAGWTATAVANPRDDKQRVEKQLDAAHGDFDQSSAHLVAVVHRLTAAKKRLSGAQDRLSHVRAKLAVARARDRSAATHLKKAVASRAQANQAVKQAQAAVVHQQNAIDEFANATYQNADITALSVVMGAQSPDELLSAMQVMDTVTHSQAATLARYNHARGQLSVQLAGAKEAAATAAEARREAAAALTRTKRLETAAKKQERSVAHLVGDLRVKRAAAARAKRQALHRIYQLEAERKRIQHKLVEIARKRAAEQRRREEAQRRRAAEQRKAEQRRAEQRREHDSGGDSGPSDSGGSGGDLPRSNGAMFPRPVNAPITSPYGMRFHPILHVWKLHDGTDFGVACGTPIHSVAAGTVVSTYFNVGYGNRVIIDHGIIDGADMMTSYNHLTRYIVSPGQHVSAGQLIAYSGTTGWSTGCHLHFMVYKNGVTVNPIYYIS